TFFRQVGGSVGLAIAGTIFGTSFAEELPRQMANNGLPQPLIDGFAQGGAASLQSDLTGVGVNLGDQILASVPEQFRPAVEPFIGGIVDAIYQAFSLAVANAMWLALFGALGAAVVAALFVPELTLRHTTGPGAESAEGTERSRPIIPAME
ncbi:MAG TPA: hypothetical protein VFN76_10900, partial [Candidatus Limnocylindria bacterium]|nr:hypothetical protein [Candidatus Limnocylindria bacterium]